VPAEGHFVAENVQHVRERIARAAARCGRNAGEITIVAISKTFPPELIELAYQAGLRHFGENRIQEWEAKQPKLGHLEASWHFIGHLQSNKARRAAHLFARIDSVDSIALAQKLDAAAAEEKRRLAVLIEVHLSEESGKTGVAEANLPALAEAVIRLPNLELRGLMTVPPYFEDPERVRPYFRKLRNLRDELAQAMKINLPILSMGMSHDFEAAIEEGATEIRVGTDIFGARAKNG
jgi:PLP dependent protein